ncbi:ATP-binding cassette domain-containing protein [Dethiothermospora halolimnae]|uniref:ABC transporter ATP-binding protein n=1 Tax=Dethiothermospora halolimnae TaxID=3114390 RepID=UPI003CCBF9F8
MIKVTNLHKSYREYKVLDGIDFQVEDGKIYGFLGHNGVGKSTTMNILTGLIDYNKGHIEIDGMSMTKNKKEIMKKIGYLPEDPKFYPYMTGFEYLNFIGEVIGYSKKDIKTRTEKLLEEVDLKKAANRKVGGYSRGMRQRLGLAVAVYNNPNIIFLDEPSSALDPEGRKDMLNIIKRLKDENITVFLSTHILNDVERVCDEVAILNDKKITLKGSLEEITNKYISPVYDIEFKKEFNSDIAELNKNKWIDKINVDKNMISVYVNNSDIAGSKLLKIISQFDNPVISYNLRKNNLEEIFMKVVKGNE